jgi:uncharacterized protein (DUF1810 family)
MSTPQDPHNLARFVTAQQPIYPQALKELNAARKTSHWMWFIFPQLAGLGHSPTAQRFALQSLEEAQAYLAHPILGPRLIECANALLQHQNKSATQILGTPDDLKLRSSATLFAQITPQDSPFAQLLNKFYNGKPDLKTRKLLDPTRP